MFVSVRVAIEGAASGFDRLYSYAVPQGLAENAKPGCRCAVPFGGGNKRRTGLIVEIESGYDVREVGLDPLRQKPLSALLDAEPLLDGEGLFLLKYLHETTFCTWFDAFRLLVPAGLLFDRKTVYSLGSPDAVVPLTSLEITRYLAEKRGQAEESEMCGDLRISPSDTRLAGLLQTGAVVKSERTRQRVSDEKQVMVRLCGELPLGLTPKQKKTAEFLLDAQAASIKEICYYTGVTRAVVNALVKKGVAEYFDSVTLRNPYPAPEEVGRGTNELSGAQQRVYDELAELYAGESRSHALLHGITGSGKTEVFLKLVGLVTEQGKTAIVLVPEISLTAQAVEKLHRRFGGRVAVLHSGLSLGERMDEWRRISSGGADVVIGTRSAVFAPVKNLGLIVIDEEQEHTYKSDKTPRYHAVDVALARCAKNRAMMLLCSATPSIERYYYAKIGRYKLFTLEERFNRNLLPDVAIVDMRDPQNASAYPSLSSVLLEELQGNLTRGEQSILLLNRRGHSTLVKCSNCGEAAGCPNCTVALTYHAVNDSLVCHYCGYSRRRGAQLKCAGCGSGLVRYAGIGTQKLEEELSALFPSARVLRVDMDTTMSKFSHERLFGAFSAGEYDIMLGTQMVAKGLNFPNVTLVGVVQADQSLYAGDYVSFERTFSLLTQVVGRGGRGEKRGRAYIQTYTPENPVIMLAAEQDYETFYRQEIEIRKLSLYPPFCSLCCVGFSGDSEEETALWAQKFTQRFKELAACEYSGLPIRLLGPSPAEILKAAGKYRYKLIVKCKNNAETRRMFRELMDWFVAESKKVSAFIDMRYDR